MTTSLIDALPRFAPARTLPRTDAEIRRVLRMPDVRGVRSLSLGPAGTNIVLASQAWIERMGIEGKAEIELCRTPEDAVDRARTSTDADVVDVIWSCAVYNREHDLFFGNPDLLLFFAQEVMTLDAMQLATTAARVEQVRAVAHPQPPGLRIAAHPSTFPLLRSLDSPLVEIVEATSNADAAQRCLRGEVEACVTTETSQQMYDLTTVHVFGSPDMVFFAGITQPGAELLERVWLDLRAGADRASRHRVAGGAAPLRAG